MIQVVVPALLTCTWPPVMESILTGVLLTVSVGVGVGVGIIVGVGVGVIVGVTVGVGVMVGVGVTVGVVVIVDVGVIVGVADGVICGSPPHPATIAEMITTAVIREKIRLSISIFSACLHP